MRLPTFLQTISYPELGYISKKEEVRNSVSCITPYGMVQGTLFLCPDDKERMWKQCVWLIPNSIS